MLLKEKFSATYGFFLIVSVIGVFTFFAGLYNILDQILLLNEVPATKLFLLQETFDIGLCLSGILLFGFSELIHIGISIERNTRRS